MLALKNTVNLDGLKTQTVVGMVIVHSVFDALNLLCTITSCNDSTHGVNSLHALGRAFDVRTKDIPRGIARTDVVARCRERLGPQFDVVYEAVGTENEHMHVEWDPKSNKVTT